MKKNHLIRLLLTAFAMSGGSALAELPSMNERPWLGYFLGTKNRDFSFGLTAQGGGMITPIGKGDKELSTQLRVQVAFVIEEVLPDGRAISKNILPETLESKDPATAKPGKVTFHGKVTGDASFEAFVEVERGTIAVGGRVLDPGTLTKNPLRFSVRAIFPEAYRSAKKTEKDAAKAFAKKLKDDRYAVLWTDGKRAKFNGADPIEADPKKVNGLGIAGLEVAVAAYQGKVFVFSASEQSKMALWTSKAQPFNEGFSINWYPDPAKDPEAKARFKFTIK